MHVSFQWVNRSQWPRGLRRKSSAVRCGADHPPRGVRPNVSEGDHKAWTMRRPWPTRVYCATIEWISG